ncbi:MAG: glycine betaine ABC transporter substrate-binding protein [Ilumatobacteraceae bacterium]
MTITTISPASASGRRTSIRMLALVAALGLAAAACGGDDEPDAADDAATTSEAGSADGAAGASSDEVITLAVAPWNGSAVNAAVAKQLIESEIGQTVETVDIDENATWPAINTDEISASLEMWPSGHAQNVTDFIDNPDGNIANAGLLGPVGKIGWYVPTYMVEQHPELATWEGFKDPELAKLFATAETGDLGQFLGGDPSFVQYDEAIIENLELPLQVVYAGSEEAILAALDSAYGREDPILFYLWTPHSAHNTYDLTEVKLPDYSDECYGSTVGDGATGDGVACDYPADDLFKIVTKDLATTSPAVNSFIEKMNYSTDDQIEMLAAVEVDGKSMDEAAAAWIEAHPDTWKAWLS